MGRLWVASVLWLVGCGRLGFADRTGDGGDDDGGGSSIGLTAMPPSINVGSMSQLVVSGATAPTSFTITTGGGFVNGTTFIAPTGAGQSTIEVMDADGARASTTVSYDGTQLFVAGGDVAAAGTASVLRSTDGGASWTQVGSLPAPRTNGGFVVYADTLFYMGGLDTGGVQTRDVYTSADGASWTKIGNLPVATTGFTATVYRGEIWYVGGASSNGNSGIAYHSGDGATWTTAPGVVSTGRHEHDLVTTRDRLYVLGGHGDTAFLDDVVATTDGSSWSTSSALLTFACDFPAAGQLDGVVLRICGSGCSNSERSMDMVTWTPAAAVPGGGRDGGSVVGTGGHYVVIGGGQTVLTTTDGSSWSNVGSLPAARTRTGAVTFTPQ